MRSLSWSIARQSRSEPIQRARAKSSYLRAILAVTCISDGKQPNKQCFCHKNICQRTRSKSCNFQPWKVALGKSQLDRLWMEPAICQKLSNVAKQPCVQWAIWEAQSPTSSPIRSWNKQPACCCRTKRLMRRSSTEKLSKPIPRKKTGLIPSLALIWTNGLKTKTRLRSGRSPLRIYQRLSLPSLRISCTLLTLIHKKHERTLWSKNCNKEFPYWKKASKSKNATSLRSISSCIMPMKNWTRKMKSLKLLKLSTVHQNVKYAFSRVG